MNIWQAFVLGVVQGLTEYLPISSSAHLRVVPALLDWQDPGPAFTAVVQLGTLAAVLIYFRSDIRRLVVGFLGGLWERNPFGSLDARQAWMIGVGTIPIVVCGLLLKDHIQTTFRSLWVIAFALIGLGLVLMLAEMHLNKRKRSGRSPRTVSDVGWWDVIGIGMAQVLALIPGSSRSGVTITAGLFAGLSRESAARFSFLLALPSVFGAGVYELIADWDQLATADLGLLNLTVATVASGVVGYLSIAFLLGFLRRYSTGIFIVYRIGLGVLIICLLLWGELRPD